ncbi:calcium-activated potassium channel subunit beta-3 isoform X2 [Dasypus novemcinctus]|uniref:calcium-activated potassium channel subunit beta-3 isoform X2 n=1 Tax=Dasypus novemcinctus TaxID=9361 RepID=UPI000328F24D|nr:calcium-activated potassium channel subunit beta-3 isoform X2 [Dasypus novemcinctus]
MQPFSVPVQITLQGTRRRPARTAVSTSGKKRNKDHRDVEAPDVHKKLPSSAGEDRAVLLGLAMMAFAVLMFFLLGTTILKPFMLSPQREESNCTIVRTHIMDDWLDYAFTCGVNCGGPGKYPCLQVFVNLSHSGQKALLHYNEEAVQTNSKCFYTPQCHRDRNDLLNSVLNIKEFFDHKNETPFSCFYSPDSRSEDVILIKKFAGDKGYLTKEDLRVLMEKEFPGFLENQEDPLAGDKIMKDLGQCQDGKMGFQSFFC